MARVMKKFEDENEYQAWVNSPYKRTPYTCVVKSTGKVYYDDGDDNDLSITLVIKKSGWMRLGSRRILSIISAITINGMEIDFDELGGDLDSSYYYRKDKDYYLKAAGDFLYPPQVYSKSQGGFIPPDWIPNDSKLLNYCPRRFAMFNPGPSISNKTPIFDNKRFLQVRTGDIVKIFCKNDYFVTHDGFDYEQLPIFWGDDRQPRFGGDITRFSKEIIIGDGFTGVVDEGLLFTYTKKVYIGKNISKVFTGVSNCRFAGHHSHCKMYVRKNTNVYEMHDKKQGEVIKI